MRIATWNVNSLKARLEKVLWWLERVRPDVLLMQETKLADADAPLLAFRGAGYELAHHGEGRWNGVAIASRVGIADVVTNLGEPLRRSGESKNSPDFLAKATSGGLSGIEPAGLSGVTPDGGSRVTSDGDSQVTPYGPSRTTPDLPDDEPLAEARMIAASCGGVRVLSLYAPNGRVVDSPFYRAKLVWYERLARWLGRASEPGAPLVLGGDFNVAPTDDDVWDARACLGATHVSAPERRALASLCSWGLIDAYRLHHPEPGRFTWWDYRGGNFYRNIGMRIDLLLVTRPVAERTIWSEIDREARKGKPVPSDHAPLVIDLDEPGHPFDAGWAGADARIASRRT